MWGLPNEGKYCTLNKVREVGTATTLEQDAIL
jgi:hypothetical protein